MTEPRPPDRRARDALVLLIALSAAVAVVSSVGVALGFRTLAASTRAVVGAVECCGTVFSSCLVSWSLLRAALPWLAATLLLWGWLRAASGLARNIVLHRRFVVGLGSVPVPIVDLRARGIEGLAVPPAAVRLIEREGVSCAFTAGFVVPRIYVTTGLFARLTPGELDAVLAHEVHHLARRDPLRTLVVLFLEDLLFFVPIGGWLKRAFLEAREEAADRCVAAAREGAGLDLAEALRRLALEKVGSWSIHPLAAGAVRTGDLVRRIRVLLDPDSVPPIRPGWRHWSVTLVLLGVVLSSLYLPVIWNGMPETFDGCGPEHCAKRGCGHSAGLR